MNEHNSTIHITSAHEESVENENIKQKRLRKKNIDCQHCDQKFSSDFQLNIHYKLGNGVPIQCVKCNFKACTPRGLDIHDKSHDEHDVTDETIEKILPILEINETDLDLNGNDSKVHIF